jgi:hypothetical protein
LLAGIGAGWGGGRIAFHLILGLISFGLIQQNVQRATLFGQWLCDRQPLHLARVGLLAMALLSVSGDSLLQPIAFTIPFVQGLLVYGPRIGAPLGGGYLALMGLGLWLGGQCTPEAIVFPLAVCGALMVVMANFLLAFQPAVSDAAQPVAPIGGLTAAQLTDSQLECLNGLEAQLQTVVVAYRQAAG